MTRFSHYHYAVRFLEGLSNLPHQADYLSHRAHPEIYLKRTQTLLDAVGNPEKDFKYVHISGTAGKGTTANLVQAMLVADGHRTGLYTSPFSTTSIEKIKVNDRYISPADFSRLVEKIKPALNHLYTTSLWGIPSYFEIFLALALLYFRQRKCEWAVLEVGLGGKYDATNVIPKPQITAITNIGYDHTEVLGKTLTKIATDKSGIIKSDSKFFTTEHRRHLLKIMQDTCSLRKVRFSQVKLSKNASYQQANFALAEAIGAALGIAADTQAKATQSARLPCRFEIMQRQPLVILDGAHNVSKMASTVFNWQTLKKKSDSKLQLVLGFKLGKDIRQMVQQIVPLAQSVYVTRFQTKEFRSVLPKELLQEVKQVTLPETQVQLYLDPHQALDAALKQAQKTGTVLVTGSFYLGGGLRTRWYAEDWVLEKRSSF